MPVNPETPRKTHESQRGTSLRWLLAVALPFAAFLIQWTFWDFLHPYAWLLFYPAVFFSAWASGFRGGLIATLLSTLLVVYFFMPDNQSKVGEYAAVITFISIGILFSHVQGVIGKQARRNAESLSALRAANETLEARMVELEQARRETESMARFPLENPNPVLRINREMILLYANYAAFFLFPKWDLRIMKRVPQDLQREIGGVFETGKLKTAEIFHNGRLFSFSIAPVLSGKYVNLYALDITEQRIADDSLRDSERRYRSLFENMIEGYAYCRISFEEGKPSDFTCLAVNKAFEEQTGLKDAAGKKASELMPSIQRANPELLDIYGRVALTQVAENFEVFIKPLRKWFSMFAYSPEKEHFVIVFTNITEQKLAVEQLRLQSKALETAANAIMITDVKGRIQWVNPAWSTLTGYSAQEALKKNPRILRSGKQDRAFYKQLWTTILAGRVWRAELVNQRKDGTLYDEEETITPVLDENGKIINFIAIKQDITERKLTEEKLRDISVHDALTGLYNRRFFEEEMKRIERGREFPVSIVMADVDGLKKVNDQQGHAAGDALIKSAACILRSAFRSEDVVARIGGDEFAALLPNSNAENARNSLSRVRRLLKEHNAANAEIPVRLSLGVGVARHPAPLSATLKNADANMYREKQKHKL